MVNLHTKWVHQARIHAGIRRVRRVRAGRLSCAESRADDDQAARHEPSWSDCLKYQHECYLFDKFDEAEQVPVPVYKKQLLLTQLLKYQIESFGYALNMKERHLYFKIPACRQILFIPLQRFFLYNAAPDFGFHCRSTNGKKTYVDPAWCTCTVRV